MNRTLLVVGLAKVAIDLGLLVGAIAAKNKPLALMLIGYAIADFAVARMAAA